jgi:hypothetical protein
MLPRGGHIRRACASVLPGTAASKMLRRNGLDAALLLVQVETRQTWIKTDMPEASLHREYISTVGNASPTFSGKNAIHRISTRTALAAVHTYAGPKRSRLLASFASFDTAIAD